MASSGVGIRVGAGSVSKSMSQYSSTGSGVDCPNTTDSGVDLTMGSGLGMDMAYGSGFGMNVMADSGSMAVGASSLWSMASTGSGSRFVGSSGVVLEDLP